MRILVKIGGAQLSEAGPRAAIAEAIERARDAGHELVVVHGGGDQIRSLSGRLGLEARYERGLRVTDAATAEVVLWVLGGEVGRTFVATLAARGLSAVSLTGADGGLFDAQPLLHEGIQLGYVGRVSDVRPAIAESLLAAGHVPVIGTIAPRAGAPVGEPFYNINADHAVAPLARALRADAVLLLSDVPGVLEAGQLIPELDPSSCEHRVATGVITGGMLPKVDSALRAAAECPGALVKIASAAGRDAVLDALRDDRGTRFRPRRASAPLSPDPTPSPAPIEEPPRA